MNILLMPQLLIDATIFLAVISLNAFIVWVVSRIDCEKWPYRREGYNTMVRAMVAYALIYALPMVLVGGLSLIASRPIFDRIGQPFLLITYRVLTLAIILRFAFWLNFQNGGRFISQHPVYPESWWIGATPTTARGAKIIYNTICIILVILQFISNEK